MVNNQTLAKLFTILDKFKVPAVLALVGLFLIGLGLLWPKLNSEKKDIVVGESSSQNESAAGKIKIDVAGAVATPGVYELSSDSRVEDAIAAAGGFSQVADTTWVSKNINLASKVADGQKIYIAAQGEVSASSSTLGIKTTGDKVNINFASAKELDTLPGIGQVTAEKIIASRPYGSVEELLTKKAVGKATYEKIKDLVSAN